MRATMGSGGWQKVLLHSFLVVASVASLFPLVWMVLTSFKGAQEIIQAPPTFLPARWTTENYATMFQRLPVVLYLANSVFIAAVSTILSVITSAVAGIVFAKYRFPLKEALFILILATTMIPFETYMIPFYLMVARVGWIDTYQGLISPLVITSFGIFLVRQFVSGIPDELLDAARIDGSSEFRIMTTILLPLSRSVLSALGIFSFMFAWAFFVWPLIITNSQQRFTLELGLTVFQNQYTVDYGVVMAGATIGMLPILLVFLLLRRHIVSAMTLSGVKG